jgi:hypothetical protein
MAAQKNGERAVNFCMSESDRREMAVCYAVTDVQEQQGCLDRSTRRRSVPRTRPLASLSAL